MQWHLIKQRAPNVDKLVRLDRVVDLEAAEQNDGSRYVTLHMDNGASVMFTIPEDEYPQFLEKLGA